MNQSWIIPKFDDRSVTDLSHSLHVSPIMAQLLIHRGLETPLEATHFLYPDKSMLHDPFKFHQMEQAIQRLKQAIQNKDSIMIHGDYDVDGVTATAILFHTLSQYTDKIMTFIPHRLNQGYGLKQEALDIAKEKNIKLIITVDCGITAVEESRLAQESGIDIIITDHHLFSDSLPHVWAIIHPSQPNETYPYTHLSGAGVAYKFAQAIEREFSQTKQYLTDDLLDLAAMGTLSDIVLLNGENRVIAKHGLAQLARSKRPGLRSLLEKTKLTNKSLESWHVGYILGPRINAAGRLGDSERALQLLITESKTEADEISDILDQYNRERQQVEKEVFDQALDMVYAQINLNTEPLIIMANPKWHIGVLGIVASKLVDEFERPVILIGMNDIHGKGSGRSVEGFHIVEALEYCSDVLIGFGGHEMACGLTIEYNQIMNFRKKINQFALQSNMPDSKSVNQLNFDSEIRLSDLTESFLDSLTLLSPYGPGNTEPLFLVKRLMLEGPPRIIKNTHLKFRVKDGQQRAEAIWFGKAEKLDLFKNSTQSWDIACHTRLNEYNGYKTIELRIKDIRPAH